MDQDLKKYLEPMVADQSFEERMSKFNVLHNKATFYADWLALKTAAAYIQKLEMDNQRLVDRLARLEES
jgi:hypothetical protein